MIDKLVDVRFSHLLHGHTVVDIRGRTHNTVDNLWIRDAAGHQTLQLTVTHPIAHN